MGNSPRGWRRSRLVLLIAVAAAVLVAAGCGSSGEPTSYDDTVESNFIGGCEEAAKDDPAISPAARQYCTCAWNRVRAEIAFEDFKALDDDVRDDADNISAEAGADDEVPTATVLTAIFADCRAQHSRG